MQKSKWEITLVQELVGDKYPFTELNIDQYFNHTFGQMFNYVRAYFKTRGGTSRAAYSWEKETVIENAAHEWFNFWNESDFPIHVDEEWFMQTYQESYNGLQTEYVKWGIDEKSPYYRNLIALQNYGVMVVMVYRPRKDHTILETLYIKRFS